tara:strand:+ start:1273 stop:2163 length:891 start_codon:yes stop_codon:yes gene_type:complete
LIDIALLTEKRYLKTCSNDWYVRNIIKEDSLVQNELEKLNISCKRVAWDERFTPSNFRFALFRATWNYFDEINNFMIFLNACKNNISLINSHDLILWNLDKRYLLSLRDQGVNIPETHIANKKTKVSLQEIVGQYGWGDIVIKPCVSAAAWNTHYVKSNNIKNVEVLFSDLTKSHDMMVQSFQKNITSRGEVSFMIIGGSFSHAVLKMAKKGDFRVQDDFGGTVSMYVPEKREIDFALYAVSKLPSKPAYARVDVIVDNNDNLALSELELIEPEMWFRLRPESARCLAKYIRDNLV